MHFLVPWTSNWKCIDYYAGPKCTGLSGTMYDLREAGFSFTWDFPPYQPLTKQEVFFS